MPYKAEHGFTCKAQVAGFKAVIEDMSSHPQDYVSDHGSNSVEGFHGLALAC